MEQRVSLARRRDCTGAGGSAGGGRGGGVGGGGEGDGGSGGGGGGGSLREQMRGTDFVTSARLDNLGKGASGAAVQNLNLALGLEEGSGLN